MVDLRLGSAERPLRRILCLGAHCTTLRLGAAERFCASCAEDSEVEIYWVVFSSTPFRRKKQRGRRTCSWRPAKRKKVVIRNYRDSFSLRQQARIKANSKS